MEGRLEGAGARRGGRDPTLKHPPHLRAHFLFDQARGWTAIDPKGVAGELEFEFGPILRNPAEPASNFSRTGDIERRVGALERVVRFDRDRVVRWGFAQAVLSCLWSIEDDGFVSPAAPALHLARALLPIVE